jgi:hypothetical protein
MFFSFLLWSNRLCHSILSVLSRCIDLAQLYNLRMRLDRGSAKMGGIIETMIAARRAGELVGAPRATWLTKMQAVRQKVAFKSW